MSDRNRARTLEDALWYLKSVLNVPSLEALQTPEYAATLQRVKENAAQGFACESVILRAIG